MKIRPEIIKLAMFAAQQEKQAIMGRAIMKMAPKLLGQGTKAVSKALPKTLGRAAPKALGSAVPKALGSASRTSRLAANTGKSIKPHVGNPTGKTGVRPPAYRNPPPTPALPPPPPNTYMQMPNNTVQQGMAIDALPDWLQNQVRSLSRSADDIPNVISSLKMDNKLYNVFKHFGF